MMDVRQGIRMLHDMLTSIFRPDTLVHRDDQWPKVFNAMEHSEFRRYEKKPTVSRHDVPDPS